MLISANALSRIYGVFPQGVVHVGAHQGEEYQDSVDQNWGHIYWIEANPVLCEWLRTRFNESECTVVEAAVWSESGIKLNFNIASNGQSSSLLQFGTHLSDYPEIYFNRRIEIETRTLKELLPSKCDANFLNLDIQGAELNAIIGLGSRLSQFNWIFTEVNKKEVYTGCPNVIELDDYLNKFGFKRQTTRWEVGKGWGDALYARESQKNSFFSFFSVVLFYLPRYFQYWKYVLRGFIRKIKNNGSN